MEYQVEVEVPANGFGRAEVPFDPSEIELVRVKGHHGTPHVRGHEDGAGKAWIDLLGAIPESTVIVTFEVAR